jgi:hypothetical protein
MARKKNSDKDVLLAQVKRGLKELDRLLAKLDSAPAKPAARHPTRARRPRRAHD